MRANATEKNGSVIEALGPNRMSEEGSLFGHKHRMMTRKSTPKGAQLMRLLTSVRISDANGS